MSPDGTLYPAGVGVPVGDPELCDCVPNPPGEAELAVVVVVLLGALLSALFGVGGELSVSFVLELCGPPPPDVSLVCCPHKHAVEAAEVAGAPKLVAGDHW